MLHRCEPNGVIAVSQPAHSWLSGELARQWGNSQFGGFGPKEDVCQAAALHDIGFLDWEQSPTLNPRTGLPHTFLDMPTSAHLDIWSAGIRRMLAYGRYPALLVSKHFTSLCQNHPSASPADRRLEKEFLDQQQALQSRLLASLLNDPGFQPFSTDEMVLRNRHLVSLWDWLSLLLCMGFRDEQLIDDVPAAAGMAAIKLKPLNADTTKVSVSPWPFAGEPFHVACEGRRMSGRYKTEQEMREALRTAPPVTVSVELLPG